MRASVVDLGYNSLKMVSYEVGPGQSFRAYDQRGALTKLGEGLYQSGFLKAAAMDRTIRELKLFNEVSRIQGVDRVLAVATSPIREAGNGLDFLRAAQSKTGLRFRVLSGAEEAILSYMGAARATKIPDAVYFDLGGGSLELTCVKGFRVRKTLSLPLGALRLTEMYGQGDYELTEAKSEEMRSRILGLLPSRKELGIGSGYGMVGVGGTLRALAKYDQYVRNYPLNKIHGYALTIGAVVSIHRSLSKLSLRKIAKLEAFGRGRAESITAGALVIQLLMERLRAREVVVSTHGLRDGVLSEFLRDRRTFLRTDLNWSFVDQAMATWLGGRRGSEEFTSELLHMGAISPHDKRILDAASDEFLDMFLLTRPERLFYSILFEDSFLDHQEQVALALSMVKAKAPKVADWFFLRYRGLLKDEAKGSVDRLAAFIQLMVLLKTTGSQASIRASSRSLSLAIMTPHDTFPTMLLEEAVGEVEKQTGLHVKTTLHEGRKPGPLGIELSGEVQRS